MKRPIIHIDENKCNGCGVCIPNCPEGALQIIDDKARLISDLFCDGLGACIKTCPQDAIVIEEREAEPYDEKRVMGNIILQGPNTIKAHLAHLHEHGEQKYLQEALAVLEKKGTAIPDFKPQPEARQNEACACPGTRIQDRRQAKEKGRASGHGRHQEGKKDMPSELKIWPIQLQLLNPQASFFDRSDLLIVADCVPFAMASFHRDFLKGRIPIIFCPKLDRVIDHYISKLTALFSLHPIRSITIAHMEVPCCSGVVEVVKRALEQAGKQIPLSESTISVSGEILGS